MIHYGLADTNKINTAILLAVLAALYAVSTPVSKILLTDVPPTMVAAFSVGGWSNGVLGT